MPPPNNWDILARKEDKEDLINRSKQEDMGTIITKHRWRWIEHILRKHSQSVTTTTLHWTSESKKKRGRSRTSRKRTVESEIKTMQ
jgi:hypothetical protein